MDFIVESEADRIGLGTWFDRIEPPFTVSVTKGKHRTVAQNRLQFEWFNEIAKHLGDTTVEEIRAYCKLHFGIPILRSESESFKVVYDEHFKGLSYEGKLKLIRLFDIPVTRIMTIAQLTEYLDKIYDHFSAEGIELTDPASINGTDS